MALNSLLCADVPLRTYTLTPVCQRWLAASKTVCFYPAGSTVSFVHIVLVPLNSPTFVDSVLFLLCY